MNNHKVAAIWCRVSTHDQRELSLDSQEVAVRKVLEAEGYKVLPQHILKVDWTSLDLMGCPEFQHLRRWIADGAVQAVGVLDRDRLQAQGLQRLVFLSECQERGIRVVTVQGVPMLESGEGQLVELALALGKEKSVLRAQQGARDGLRDRALLKGLSPTMASPFGMKWEKTPGRPRLVPDERYEDICLIWRLALEGVSGWAIAKELTSRGVPTRKGRPVWQPTTVLCMLHNRAYAGVVEALSTEAVVPKRRRGGSYGKSGRRSRPVSERIRLEGLVAQPIVTEEEFQWVQEKLLKNSRLARRNGKLRVYLLRGMFQCSACGRSYVGVTREGRSYYYCRGTWGLPHGIRQCSTKARFFADDIEESVYGAVVEFLKTPEAFLAEAERRHGLQAETIEGIGLDLAGLEREDARARDDEAMAFRQLSRGKLSQDVYDQEVGLLQARRRWIAGERERLRSQLADLERHHLRPEGVEALYRRLEARLATATVEDRRFVLETLDTHVTVQPDGAWHLAVQVPFEAEPQAQTENIRPGTSWTCMRS